MTKCLAVFIDAANLWEVQKAKAKLLDLAKLKKHLKFQRQILVIMTLVVSTDFMYT